MEFIAKILAFYFLLGSMLPQTDFSQLGKTPKLWEHFNMHQKEASLTNESINFFEFFRLHYFNSDEHQHQGQQNSHKDLPFQDIQTSNTLIFQKFLESGLFQELFFPENKSIHKSILPLPGFAKAIFRPPSV